MAPGHSGRVAVDAAARGHPSLAADIDPFLRQIADRPRLVAERRRQLEWWAARLGHLRRDAIAPADVRAALAELRQTHAASTCNHYRQALFSLYRTLGGRDAPNPLQDVKPFTSPAPEARGLSYYVVQRILATMSDQGSARVKGNPRAAASAAKVRCRVLAFTGLRPSELMRYRPEHWNRSTQTLVVYTGKGGRTRTIPLSAPAAEALADLEAVGAIGPFSTSSVRRAFIRAAERIGIHGVRPYDLRHSYATALYRVAGDTRLVKDVLGSLGHADDGAVYSWPRAGGDALGDVPFRGAPRGSGAPSGARKRASGGAQSWHPSQIVANREVVRVACGLRSRRPQVRILSGAPIIGPMAPA